MQLLTKKNIILLVLLYIALAIQYSAPTQARSLILVEALQDNSTTHSPWLTRMNNNRGFPPGCRWRPWICNQDDSPRIRRRCCRNRCVDVSSDVNNCGLCGIRCPFTRQCCRGICVNTNRNPFHCGRCDHRCRFPIRCVFGMCGYAQPPFPFPPPPEAALCASGRSTGSTAGWLKTLLSLKPVYFSVLVSVAFC